MDPIHRFRRPALRTPRALVAFEGWNDACEAASGALAYVLEQYGGEPFAVIEPEEFYDFQVSRPVVSVVAGHNRNLAWPDTRFFDVEMPEADHDLVIVLGDEPNLRWKTYTRLIAQVLGETGVEAVVTLGAFIGQVAHTLPVPIVGVATDPALIADRGLLSSHYEGPTGVPAVLLEACREAGIPTIGLWAATPHYLAANPNPKAMLALLQRAAELSGVPVDTGELEQVATEFEGRVESAMVASSDLTDYVRTLEKGAADDETPEVAPGAGRQLVEELEQFLRDQG